MQHKRDFWKGFLMTGGSEDLADQADQRPERSQGNFLVDWLPCIDSDISERVNGFDTSGFGI
jgi:hypothetical protein